ncbi:aldehyde dehydrogenase [Acinetobacter sp. WZC-1]|uniref:aldehyde dehydrogenase n=1 Tax=Acinetobacter sp. WZC-1 TaxID=3459034 RepID=UPI00403DB3B4
MLSSDKSLAEWKQVAETLQIETRAFINGQYVNAISGKTFENRSPIDGRLLGNIADCGAEDVDLAVEAAKQAFESGVWSRRTPAERKSVLLKLADLLTQHEEELAVLESLDMGKTIRESLDMDMKDAASAIRYYAESIDKIHDLIAPTGEAFHGTITHEPIGVVAAMTPWNNPLMIASWKIAPVLAMGNSLVFKPSEKASSTVIRLAALAKEAGIPDGVFNVVTGMADVGKRLGLHPDIGAFTFTGSTNVAKQLQIYSGESNMKRMYLEGGGKNAHIIFADTPDLAKVAKFAALGFCANQGEVCASGTRLLVEESIKDEFVKLLVKELQGWKPGHPLDPQTAVGALVDEQHLERVKRYVDSAAPEGASIATGGKRSSVEEGGVYFEPTLIDNATPEMTASREEIFGPVASVITFKTEEEAVHLANNTTYGLTAGFWTPDLAKAHRVARQLEAGTVWVNHFLTRDILSPFGGYKQSGIGKDLSILALHQYTNTKATWYALKDVQGH